MPPKSGALLAFSYAPETVKYSLLELEAYSLKSALWSFGLRFEHALHNFQGHG